MARETILAIDPSINYPGYAILSEGRLVWYGVLKTWEGTKKGSDRERLLRLQNTVADLIEKHRPSVVVIEDYQFRAADVRLRNKDHIKKMIWSIGTCLLGIPNHIPVVFFKPQEWKGRKSKDDIIFEAKAAYRIQGKLNNNAADAIMLAHHLHTGAVIQTALKTGAPKKARKVKKRRRK